MTEDLSMAIQWTCDNIHKYKGDKSQIVLMGHSAGSHLLSLTLLEHCKQQCETKSLNSDSSKQEQNKWSLTGNIRGWIALCGVYNLGQHYEYEMEHCKEVISPMWRVTKGIERFPLFSPSLILTEAQQASVPEQAEFRHMVAREFPRSFIFHSVKDTMIPKHQSQDFCSKLKEIMEQVKRKQEDLPQYIELEGFTHSDPVCVLMKIENNAHKKRTMIEHLVKCFNTLGVL